MCYTETYLAQKHDIKGFLTKHHMTAFFLNVPSVQQHSGQHGIMICVSKSYKSKELCANEIAGLEYKVVLLQTPVSQVVIALVYRNPSRAIRAFVEGLVQLLH